MNTKKAQLQLGESIFVVIIIILLIVFVIIFTSQAEQESYERKADEFTDLETIMLSQFASTLAELRCSTLQVEELSCFDKHKLQAFGKLQEEYPQLTAEFYFTQLGDANITLEFIYPQQPPLTLYYNGIEADNTTILERRSIVPVSIYDDLTQTYTFALLHITKYTRSS